MTKPLPTSESLNEEIKSLNKQIDEYKETLTPEQKELYEFKQDCYSDLSIYGEISEENKIKLLNLGVVL